jgi:sugar lactone lactonase YvrE
MTRISLILALAGLWIGVTTSQAAVPAGALSQLPGVTGCFTLDASSEDGLNTCGLGRGLGRGESATVSPDGRNVYVGSYNAPGPLPPGLAVFTRAADGQLTQLSGLAGCFSPDGSSAAGPNTCTEARGLRTNAGDGRDLVITSDGRWAYLAAQNNNPRGAILLFQRDPASGALTQLPAAAGCISGDGSSQDGAGTCQTNSNLSTPQGLTLSSDDRFLYAADYSNPYRLHVFSVNGSTGALTDIQCLAEDPAPSGCDTARVVGNSQSVAISPDGLHLYGGEFNHGLSIFNRNPATGLLTQKPAADGCVTDDGKDDTGAITCASGRNLEGTYPFVLSPDGHTLYNPAGGDGGVSIFHVNADGTLAQLPGADGCITKDGKDNNGALTCTVGRGVVGPYGAAMSPDGANLYVSDFGDGTAGGFAAFSLDPASGRATQIPGPAGCTTADGSSNAVPGVCTAGRALGKGYGVTVSPDGMSVYQATDQFPGSGLAIFSRGFAPTCTGTAAQARAGGSVTITLQCADANGESITRSIASGPGHGKLAAVSGDSVTYTPTPTYRGADSFTFTGSDGANTTAPATVALTVTGRKFPGSALVTRTLTVDSRGRVKLRVSCPADTAGGTCANVVSLLSPTGRVPLSAKKAKLLGHGRFSLAAGQTKNKRLRLNKAGRKVARGHARFKARLVLRSSPGASPSTKHTYKVTVKHAKKKRKR